MKRSCYQKVSLHSRRQAIKASMQWFSCITAPGFDLQAAYFSDDEILIDSVECSLLEAHQLCSIELSSLSEELRTLISLPHTPRATLELEESELGPVCIGF